MSKFITVEQVLRVVGENKETEMICINIDAIDAIVPTTYNGCKSKILYSLGVISTDIPFEELSATLRELKT